MLTFRNSAVHHVQLQCCVCQAGCDWLDWKDAIAQHLLSYSFYMLIENRFCLFPLHSHSVRCNAAAFTQKNLMIKYVESENLHMFCGMPKQFSDLRASAGWRRNLKDCSSNRTERKIMRKVMRKERTINRWRRTVKWERGRIIPISIRTHTHTHLP